jgi:hypothetical protein
MNFETTPGELWASANRRSFLKNGERSIHLELGGEGKFPAKSSGWDENRVFLEGDKIEVAAKNGRWVLTHLPASLGPW